MATGLKLSRSRRVDLVLTHIDMPRMGGLELLAAIKGPSEWAAVPAVMITTEGGESKVAEAVRLGAAGYVWKPFTADQIKEKLVGLESRQCHYERREFDREFPTRFGR